MSRHLIVTLLVALALVVLTVQNPNPVAVQFLSWEAQQVPVIVIVLISLSSGVIIASFLGLIKQSKLKSKIRLQQRMIEDLKQPPPVSPDDEEDSSQ
ncbi:MAG: hypothetical protein CEE38_19950 [Planctomycetes bacterium B3_Pla]|nr:MAG: hypothetical protein CEE38_19950 [Planctomycetes bacterium B3_Pla]